MYLPKEHVHTYTDLYSKDENNEVWKCSEDDSKITKEHQEFRLISDSQAPEETWTCDSCGYERKQPHSVEFTSSLDDAGELWTCTTETCGYTETKEHTLDTGTINKENHSIIYSCENKSCNYEKEEYKGEEYVFKSNDGPTGETWECTICGSKITKDHVLGPEITEEDGKYQYCTTVDCDYKKSTHIHVIAYKEKLISTKDECVEKTPFCINCDYEGTPFIISEHDYGESRYGLRCRKCGYVLENDLEEEYEEITEDLTESYTINPNKTYGYNIYYKTSSVPTEDKPLTLTLRKKDERGNY